MAEATPDTPAEVNGTSGVPPNVQIEDESERHPSPFDSGLLDRKMQRELQKSPLLRPALIAGGVELPDSPNLQGRIDTLREGNDPTTGTSPVGTALLQRKAQNQRPAASKLAQGDQAEAGLEAEAEATPGQEAPADEPKPADSAR